MTRRALVVSDGPQLLGWVENALGDGFDVVQLSISSSPDEAVSRVAGDSRIELLFCEIDSPRLPERVALIERLSERFPHLPVVGIGAQENAEWTLASMRAGARDFFVMGRDDASLPGQIERLLRRASSGVAAAAATTQKPGRIYSVMSGHPHESIAFLAEHLALALVEAQSGERVLLLDLATPSGAGAIFLNLTQTYNVLNAIGDAHRCDQTLVDTAFTKHTSGLYVLSLPEDLVGTPSINVDEFLHLLKVLATLFAHVVVAVDGHLPVRLLAGVENQSDRLLLLSDQSILKSRHNKYLLRAMRLEGCTMAHAGLVVDNYRRRLGLEPVNLAELFDIPLVASLQTESYNRVVSMNSGEPLFTMARKDPYWLGVKQLAVALVSGQAAVKPEASGLIKRLLK